MTLAIETAPDGRPMIRPNDRQAWRDWLADNHESSRGIWVAFYKPSSGRSRLGYAEIVEEALCFGWIDSRGGKLDAERTLQWLGPRNPRSAWSKLNKERVERLTAAGLIMPAGRKMIDLAKQTGTWSKFDAAEDLVVPEDLAAALASHDGAADHWQAFRPSLKRSLLEWVHNAKRPETRARRIEEVAARMAAGETASQWLESGLRVRDAG